jgi:uncharacterized protein YbjQ (UPF0145 family)
VAFSNSPFNLLQFLIGFPLIIILHSGEVTQRLLSFSLHYAPHKHMMIARSKKCSCMEVIMIVVTTEGISHFRIVETKGQVFGLVVRSRGLGGNIMAGLRSLGGGEITEYTQLLEEARRHAIDRMVQNATTMGANAIVRMQFDSSEIGQTMSEIVAYGTAVVIEPEG